MSKFSDYAKKMSKFLNKNYKVLSEERSNYLEVITFKVKTKNKGIARMTFDLYTCARPYSYSAMTRGYCYDEDGTMYTGDVKSPKNNILAIPTIEGIQCFISLEYESTL